MPYSSDEGKQELKVFLSNVNDVSSVLDIGPGAGTYFDLLSDTFKNARWTGIEVWKPYIERFSLSSKYDIIINDDALKIDWPSMDNYDMIIMGDVLEHMPEHDALRLINSAVAKSRLVIMSIPIITLIQGAEEGNPYETHLAYYTPQSVIEKLLKNHEILYKREYNVVGVYVIAGELNDKR